MITKFESSDRLCGLAREIIPGGCHTYSKGADQSPNLGPKFIARGKGCYVWDVDGNKYLDWSMGLTAVNLGHAYKPVLDAVKRELVKGSNFQCPSPIEAEAAEYFLGQVPGAEMVKFAKNGSTVTTAAVKLARAYTGRKYVAFCDDHGFFSYDDWYIGKKACSSGVPEEISSLSLTFRYNDIGSVERLFSEHSGRIACDFIVGRVERIPSPWQRNATGPSKPRSPSRFQRPIRTRCWQRSPPLCKRVGTRKCAASWPSAGSIFRCACSLARPGKALSGWAKPWASRS